MLRIALTGGVSTGKSTALKIFRDFGCGTISSDLIIKELMTRDDVLKNKLKTLFNCLDENGNVDSKKLGKIIFNSVEARKKIEAITHPLVNIVRKEFFRSCENKGIKYAVCETPLLFEKDLSHEFDYSILMVTSLDIRIDRFIGSGKGDQEKFFQITKNQMLDREKIDKADYVIKNNGSIEQLKEKIQNIMFDIVKENNFNKKVS